MKNFKTGLAAILVLTTMTFMSCKDNAKEEVIETETIIKTEKLGKEYTSKYVCPMHCKDSGSDSEGTCGTCGMQLIKNEDHTANGHTHE